MLSPVGDTDLQGGLLSSPAERQTLSVRQTVAHNVERLRRARGWTIVELERRVTQVGGAISRSTLSRLEQQEQKVGERGEVTRVGHLRVQEMLDLARALGVSPLALLAPPARALLRLGETASAQRVSGRRFRQWLVGRTPLTSQDSEWFYDNVPDSVAQTEEWHELRTLAADAVWLAQNPEIGYAEAMHHVREIKARLDLLMEQLELGVRRRDPDGHARWQQRRTSATGGRHGPGGGRGGESGTEDNGSDADR